jgi:hypothetical protein
MWETVGCILKNNRWITCVKLAFYETQVTNITDIDSKLYIPKDRYCARFMKLQEVNISAFSNEQEQSDITSPFFVFQVREENSKFLTWGLQRRQFLLSVSLRYFVIRRLTFPFNALKGLHLPPKPIRNITFWCSCWDSFYSYDTESSCTTFINKEFHYKRTSVRPNQHT